MSLTRAKWFSVLLLLAAITACSHPESPAIRFGLANMPVNMDPRYTTDAAGSRLNRLIYQRLVEFDANRKPIPGIAQWQQTAPQTYRFTLLADRIGKFHNGDELTSADVKATFDYILDEKNASPHRASLSVIEHIETPDDNTVDFFLTRNDPLFPAFLVIGILPQRPLAQGHDFDRSPLGSGPFRFESRQDEGHVTLRRLNDQQKLELIHVPNPTVRVLKLMRGEIDLVQNDLPPELVRYLANKDELQFTRAAGGNFAYLGFNFNDPLLSRVEIRRAIAHAIDRQKIIQYLFGDMARPANTLLPPDHWASVDLPGYEYAPQKARELLRQAGINDGQIRLNYKTSSDPFRIRVATILQAQLAQVGIKLDIHSYDWGTFYGDIKAGRFQIYSLAWIGIKTPDIFHYALHSDSIPPKGANRGFFAQPEIDALIVQAETQSDLAQQAKHYQHLQASLLEWLPFVPLWYENHISISSKKIQGYQILNDGSFDGLFTTVKKDS